MTKMQSLSNVNITINLEKLKYNIQHSIALCKEKSVDLAVVTKSICADKRILDVINSLDITTIADSRLDNFSKINTTKHKLLIRPSIPAESDAVIKYCDSSFQTELETVKALGDSATAQNKSHSVFIMVDLGDLRDGIIHTDNDYIISMAEYIHNHRFLKLIGVAANYNCFVGLQPDKDNMSALVTCFNLLKDYFDTDKPILSGGNSSSVSLLNGSTIAIPDEINQFRMGEAIMLGRDPADNSLIDGYQHDVFTLNVPLLEVAIKPIKNAPCMRRGVLSIGKQDLQIDHILPIDKRIKVLGACSDECVIDLSDAPEYKTGDIVQFNLEYGALMTAFAGSFINKTYI